MRKVMLGLLIISSIGLISCGEKEVKADTPVKAAHSLKLKINSNNYEGAKELFTEELKETLTKEKFEEIKPLLTAGAEYVLYETITLENGEMLLVRMTQEKVNGEYKIEDVTIIPEEMRSLFDIKE